MCYNPVPRGSIPPGSKGNAICCHIRRNWKDLGEKTKIRVHEDFFFGQTWFAQLWNITPNSPWRRWLTVTNKGAMKSHPTFSVRAYAPVHITVTNARGNPGRKQRKWGRKPLVHWLTYPVCSDERTLTEFPARLLPWNWCFWLDIKESHLQRLSFGLIPRAESYHSIFEKKYRYKVFICKCGSDLMLQSLRELGKSTKLSFEDFVTV